MSRWLPHLLLGLLLLAAGFVWAAGWHWSETVEIQRVSRDRKEIVASAQALQTVLTRLEGQYSEHLQRLTKHIHQGEDLETKRACENIVGVTRCSFLNPEDSARIDQHLDLFTDRAAPLRRFALFKRGKSDNAIVLQPEEVYIKFTGWVESQAHPACYIHVLESGAVIALTIDEAIVAKAIEKSIQSEVKLPQPFASDRILSPAGNVVVTTAQPPPPGMSPDFVQPVNTRFGLWQIECWDDRKPVTHIDQRLRTGSGVGAAVIALVGIATFWQQRRALHRAQQRVSFVNSVSHELRTPLTNMQLNLDLAAEELPEHPRLDHVRQEAGRLGRLVENMLTFSRADQGRLQLHLRPCDVRALIPPLVETFAPLFQRRGITFESKIEVPGSITLDADALTQILSNLLSNIEKYAPQAHASLTATVENDQLCIAVQDHGLGIPAADAARIFEPFVRLSETVTEGVTGTGLGLAIARDLAQRMNGTLDLVPSERGARFQLILPAIVSPP